MAHIAKAAGIKRRTLELLLTDFAMNTNFAAAFFNADSNETGGSRWLFASKVKSGFLFGIFCFFTATAFALG